MLVREVGELATAIERVQRAERRLFARYGLEVDSHDLRLEALRTTVRVLECGSGPPVLLLHGAGEISSQWAPFLAHLEGRRAIAVDLPGFGLSDHVDYELVDPRRFGVAVAREVFDAYGFDSVPVVANSLGGAWALWLAVESSQRLSAIALLGCPVFALRGAHLNPALATMAIPGVNRFVLNLPIPPLPINRMMYKLILGRDAINDSPPEIVEVAHHAMDRPNFVTALTSLLERTARLGRPRPDVTLSAAELAHITHPTLFVWGDEDGFGDVALAEKTVERMPNARLEVVHGGHNPWLNAPETCARLVLDFLGQVEGQVEA